MIKSFYYDKKTLNIVYIVKVRGLLKKVEEIIYRSIIVMIVIKTLIVKPILKTT